MHRRYLNVVLDTALFSALCLSRGWTLFIHVQQKNLRRYAPQSAQQHCEYNNFPHRSVTLVSSNGTVLSLQTNCCAAVLLHFRRGAQHLTAPIPPGRMRRSYPKHLKF